MCYYSPALTVITRMDISFEPGKVSFRSPSREGVERLFLENLGLILRDILRELFLSQDFSAEGACLAFQEEVISRPVEIPAEEVRKRSPADVISEAGSPLESLVMPPAFQYSVVFAIWDSERTLRELEKIHHNPVFRATVLPLMRRVDDILRQGGEGTVDSLIETIEPLIGNRDYTIENADQWLLFCFPYLPNDLRRVVAGLFEANLDIAFLSNAASEESAIPREFLENLITHLRLSVFLNRSYRGDLNKPPYGGSESAVNKIAKILAEDRVVLAKVEDLAQRDERSGFLLDGYQKHMVSRRELMFERNQFLGTELLMFTDIGHCFPAGTQELHDCLLGAIGGIPTYNKREKDGRLAVVFEDDPIHMERVCDLIENYSSLSVHPQGGRCRKPEEVAPFADDERVALFVLDVANDEDRYAGIAVARMLAERIRERGLKPNTGAAPRIVVQSSSSELVQTAKKELRDTGISEIDIMLKSSRLPF